MASAGPTPICRWSHNTECHGATLDPSTETGSTWSFLDVQAYACASHPLIPHLHWQKQEATFREAWAFTKSLEDDLSAGHRCNTASRSWNHLHEVIQKSALATFGRKTSKNCDWFEAKSEKLIPVIVTKHASLAENKRSPIEKTLSAIRSAGSKVQQREQEDGPMSTGGGSLTTSRLQQQQATSGAYMRASRKLLDQPRAKQYPWKPAAEKWWPTKLSRWRDGWNTSQSSTPERRLLSP